MTPPLHASILRFWNSAASGRVVAGTGFLAAGADGVVYALTCGHVANLALGRAKQATEPLATGTTTADLFGGGLVTLDLVAWFAPAAVGIARAGAVADIAIFAPRERFAPPFLPPLRLEPPGRVVPAGHRIAFHSFGYMGPQDGMPTHGELTGVDAAGWFVADGEDGFHRFMDEGLSGAPVFANGAVLGMVVQRFERETKQGLVIPAFALAQAWPPLAQPYPGLPAFDATTAHLYFGRGRPRQAGEAPAGRLQQVADRLASHRLVGLMGASGSGKSSLARAGVAPFYGERGWATIVFRPGLNPMRSLADAIAEGIEGLAPGPGRVEAADRWEKRLEEGKLAAALDAARGTGATGTLIVADQFEEFFTATGAREAEIAHQRGVLLPQLMAVVERADTHCLLTARLDLIERMVTGDGVAARMLSDPHLVILTTMSLAEVLEAVEGPAGVFGVRVDRVHATALASETTRGEGRLPLLQAALRQAWSGIVRGAEGWWMGRPEAETRKPGTAPGSGGDEAGVLEAALGARADAALAELRRRFVEADLRRVLLSLVRLVEGKSARRLVVLAEVETDDRAVLEGLADERLVTLDGAQGTAELVHEALMTRWPLLRDWIGEEEVFLVWRDRFDREFAAWEKGQRQAVDLLRSQDVVIGLGWLGGDRSVRRPPTAAERDYILASQAHHDAEQERQQRLLQRTRKWLRIAGTAAVVAVIAFAVATWAGFEATAAKKEADRQAQVATVARNEATRQAQEATAAKEKADKNAWEATVARNEADRQAQQALLQESRALAALAQQESQRGDQLTAVLLALEALPMPAFGNKRPLSPEALSSLRQAWMRNRETALLGHGASVFTATFSADGQRVVTASADRTARVWDLSGPRPVATVLEGHTSGVSSAAFSADGRYVVTASWDETARVWDLSGPRPVATVLEGHTGAVSSATFSADGRRVVTASRDETARVWDLSGAQPVATVLEGHTDAVST
ncbi:MAG: hypothetical protein AB7F35_15240, partial [Acetobacteraceae bacterium]